MNWIHTANDLKTWLRQGDLSYCTEQVCQIIRSRPTTPFHDVLDLTFTNDPEAVAWHFDRYFRGVGRGETRLAAFYTEMNAFDINPDYWYCQIFGYWEYGGTEDYEWLADSVEMYTRDIWLIGMEPLQKHYEANMALDRDINAPPDDNLDEVIGYCNLLIVLRFQELIQRSAAHMQAVHIPVLATAHDYDFIYQIIPNR